MDLQALVAIIKDVGTPVATLGAMMYLFYFFHSKMLDSQQRILDDHKAERSEWRNTFAVASAKTDLVIKDLSDAIKSLTGAQHK